MAANPACRPNNKHSSSRHTVVRHAHKWLTSNYSFHGDSCQQLVTAKLYAEYVSSIPKSYKPLGRTSFGRAVKKQFPAVKLVRRNIDNCRTFQYVGLTKREIQNARHSSSSQTRTATSEREPLSGPNSLATASDDSCDSSSDLADLSDGSDEEFFPLRPKRSAPQRTSPSVIAQLKTLIPADLASDPQWMDLFTEQVTFIESDQRWSISIIQLAMDIYTQSPKTYTNVCKVMKFPSITQLLRYKNFVKQQPGIVQDNLHWMVLEANRRQVTKEGRSGLIVFDEMYIQPDLQSESAKVDADLVGFIDHGYAQSLHTMFSTGGKVTLATHVLQFMFLGSEGFSWPVCYYSTTEADGSDLMGLVWKAVNAVQLHGFQVEGVLMAGNSNNRKFVKLHFPDGHDILQTDFRLQNPDDNNHHVSVMVDPSHVIKGIRNRCLESRNQSNQCSLRWGGNSILWDHWEQAYSWNEQTPSKVYQKLSKEHIYLTDGGETRSQLAMEVLNSEMLHLMQEFQRATGRADLELTLRLLKHTSRLVDSFTSNRPILKVTDDRLVANSQALEFFQQWYSATKTDPSSFISKETFEDLTSTITSYQNIISKRLEENPSTPVNPSIINSDIIANFFCSLKGICEDANIKLTVLGYSRAINSLLLTTDRQKLANQAGCDKPSVGGAHPYKTLAKRSFRR